MSVSRDLEAVLRGLVRSEVEQIVDERLAARVVRSPWFTTEEAAEYLRTTEKAIRHRAQRGTIPAHKDDAGRWLFHRDELDGALTRGS